MLVNRWLGLFVLALFSGLGSSSASSVRAPGEADTTAMMLSGRALFQRADRNAAGEPLCPKYFEQMQLGVQNRIGGLCQYVGIVQTLGETDGDGDFNALAFGRHRSDPLRAGFGLLNSTLFDAVAEHVGGRGFQSFKHFVKVRAGYSGGPNFGLKNRKVHGANLAFIRSADEEGRCQISWPIPARTSVRAIVVCSTSHRTEHASARARRQAPEVLGPSREAPNQKQKAA